MLLKLHLLDVAPPSVSALAAAVMATTGQRMNVAVGGTALKNFLDSLDDVTMALESVIAHILIIGDNVSMLQAAVLLKASYLPINNNTAVLTISLQQVYDYVVANTQSPNPSKLVSELYSTFKSTGIFADHSANQMSSGLKLTYQT